MKSTMMLFFACLSIVACSQNKTTAAYQNIDNKSFAGKMNEADVVILDVRTPEEYKEGHIPNATLINFHDADFAGKIGALDKDKTYLVYCAAGGRSSKASSMMTDKGFQKVYNLKDGFSHWDGAVEK